MIIFTHLIDNRANKTNEIAIRVFHLTHIGAILSISWASIEYSP